MLDIHWVNVLARPRSPILVTYNGIHGQVHNTERGPGGSAPRKMFASHALQIAGKYLFSFVIYSRLFRKLTATQKYNVCLKVISGYFKSKMPLQEYKRQHKCSEFSRNSARIKSYNFKCSVSVADPDCRTVRTGDSQNLML